MKTNLQSLTELYTMTQKTFPLALVLLLAIAAFTGCKKDDDDNGGGGNSNADILPGIGLKQVKIGEPAQKALDVFGTIAPSYIQFNGQHFHFLFYLSRGINVSLEPSTSDVFDPNTKISSFNLSDPYAGKTDKNIGIGSTLTEVRAAYGTPDPVGFPDIDTYASLGISFSYDDQDKVESISVVK